MSVLVASAVFLFEQDGRLRGFTPCYKAAYRGVVTPEPQATVGSEATIQGAPGGGRPPAATDRSLPRGRAPRASCRVADGPREQQATLSPHRKGAGAAPRRSSRAMNPSSKSTTRVVRTYAKEPHKRRRPARPVLPSRTCGERCLDPRPAPAQRDHEGRGMNPKNPRLNSEAGRGQGFWSGWLSHRPVPRRLSWRRVETCPRRCCLGSNVCGCARSRLPTSVLPSRSSVLLRWRVSSWLVLGVSPPPGPADSGRGPCR